MAQKKQTVKKTSVNKKTVPASAKSTKTKAVRKKTTAKNTPEKNVLDEKIVKTAPLPKSKRFKGFGIGKIRTAGGLKRKMAATLLEHQKK